MGGDALMKFSLISDMHVDHPQPKTPYDLLEKIVVVAGDTANGLEGLKFLQKLRNKGFIVKAVDGNHEHYRNASQGRPERETTARFREEHPRYSEEEGVSFILANGWYVVEHEALWRHRMNDSRMGSLTAEQVNALATQDWLSVRQRLEEVKAYQKKAVVVTHTAPCIETLNPEYAGDYSNVWYHNPHMRNLLAEFKEQILVWCHGHTHAPNEASVEGVRVICNPRGYPGENPNWKPLTVEV